MKADLMIIILWSVLQCYNSLGSNPAIIENDLGTTLIACSENYCKDKDSLDLWLTMEWMCHTDDSVVGDGSGYDGMDTTSTIIQAVSRRKLEREKEEFSRRRLGTIFDLFGIEKVYVSRFVSGALSSAFGILGLCAGLHLGRLWSARKFNYIAIPTRDHSEKTALSRSSKVKH